MTIYGIPVSMFLVFVATVIAGSLGATHYLVWHVVWGKPFGDEEMHLERRDPTERTVVRERRVVTRPED